MSDTPDNDTAPVRRALLSAYDKTGMVDLGRALVELGWELVSSGGTAKVLAEAGLPVMATEQVTGFADMLGHRVVTLHPAIHGGILADRDDPSHVADMDTHGIVGIDLVAVNLYPFSSEPSVELIDIGGPTMVRGAAKNHAHVAVLVDPADYAVTGRTTVYTLSVVGSVVSGQTLTVVLYDLTAASAAATLTWTETSATRKTASVTAPGSAHVYELRVSCSGSTAAHYGVTHTANLRITWS